MDAVTINHSECLKLRGKVFGSIPVNIKLTRETFLSLMLLYSAKIQISGIPPVKNYHPFKSNCGNEGFDEILFVTNTLIHFYFVQNT